MGEVHIEGGVVSNVWTQPFQPFHAQNDVGTIEGKHMEGYCEKVTLELEDGGRANLVTIKHRVVTNHNAGDAENEPLEV